jgi:hypothetical protein
MDERLTDGEYQEFLNALAYRHLVANWQTNIYPAPYIDLYAGIDKLAASARLLRVVSDRPDNAALLMELSRELQNEPLAPVASSKGWGNSEANDHPQPDSRFSPLAADINAHKTEYPPSPRPAPHRSTPRPSHCALHAAMATDSESPSCSQRACHRHTNRPG